MCLFDTCLSIEFKWLRLISFVELSVFQLYYRHVRLIPGRERLHTSLLLRRTLLGINLQFLFEIEVYKFWNFLRILFWARLSLGWEFHLVEYDVSLIVNVVWHFFIGAKTTGVVLLVFFNKYLGLFLLQIDSIDLYLLFLLSQFHLLFIFCRYLLFTPNLKFELVNLRIQNQFEKMRNAWFKYLRESGWNFLHFDKLPVIKVTFDLDIAIFILRVPKKSVLHFLVNFYVAFTSWLSVWLGAHLLISFLLKFLIALHESARKNAFGENWGFLLFGLLILGAIVLSQWLIIQSI